MSRMNPASFPSRAALVVAIVVILPGCAGSKTETQDKDGAEATTQGKTQPQGQVETQTQPEVTMDAKAADQATPVKPQEEPQHIQVQHILIGFAGSVPGKPITRTKEQAKELAYQILARARKGESFDELVREYTDDSPPGIYGMSGIGVSPGPGEYPRDRMVPAFGSVGFAISPGNIGVADYDPAASPYGWHVIKRLK